jgi:hypothetical protein
LYVIILMVTLCGLLSLAVDYGRVQLARTELRNTSESAARAGAAGLLVDSNAARSAARDYGRFNFVDGTAQELSRNQDIFIGAWDSRLRRFVPGASNPNAIRVIGRRSPTRGSAIPMTFASFVGFNNFELEAESIAMVIPPVNVDQYVPATANPFLAGMPAGSKASLNNPHNSPDTAGTARDPKQSPLAVNMPITEGAKLTFDSISGDARHDPNLAYFKPDGELSDIGHNTNASENGIGDMTGPINALVGVFLSDEAPNRTAPPKALDFSSDAKRDFSTLQPELKQIFFIGDGLNSKGAKQEFIVPKGATRLYLATWDFYEWNNNAGSRNILVQRPMQVLTVK